MRRVCIVFRELRSVRTAGPEARTTVVSITTYRAFVALEVLLIVILGGKLAEVSARSTLALLEQIETPGPNLMQLRERELVAQALHLPREHVPERRVAALTLPPLSAGTIARGLDLAEGAERLQGRQARSEPVCPGACRRDRARVAVKRTGRAKAALNRRAKGPDAGTIFARNLLALAPAYK